MHLLLSCWLASGFLPHNSSNLADQAVKMFLLALLAPSPVAQVTLDPAQYKTKGNPSLCTPSLALTWREYEQLLAGYDAYMSYLNARLTDEELIKFLFEVTAGQVCGPPAQQAVICLLVRFTGFHTVWFWWGARRTKLDAIVCWEFVRQLSSIDLACFPGHRWGSLYVFWTRSGSVSDKRSTLTMHN